MLYLSRFVGELAYGIVDTDDDVETVITRAELRELVLKHKLEIKGVEVDKRNLSAGIKRIFVYQDPRYCTPRQVKAKAMMGVDITLYKTEIVRIAVVNDLAKSDNIRIRLSDFGQSIDGRLPISVPSGRYNFKLTLVLDDNIKVRDIATKVGLTGVCFDISELSGEQLVSECYNSLAIGAGVDPENWRNYLIDTGDRDIYWRYLYYLNQTHEDMSTKFAELDWRGHKCDVAERLENTFFWDWAALTLVDVKKYFDKILTTKELNEFFHTYRHRQWKLDKECTDFKIARGFMPCLCKLMRLGTYVNALDVIRFGNYIKYFGGTEQVQELCLKLYNNICGALHYCCTKRGIKIPR